MTFDPSKLKGLGDDARTDQNGSRRAARKSKRKNDGAEHTEVSIARLFAEKHAGQVVFEHQRGRWYVCTDGIWHDDATGIVPRLILALVVELGDRSFERHARLRGIEAIAKTLELLAITSDRFDADPFILGTPGGYVDLKTGDLCRPDPTKLITMSSPVVPATMLTPRWLRFLNECTGGDAGLIRFLQQFAGYGLTGDTREQCLLFIYGSGRNGKGVFLRALTGILGGYAHRAQVETFTAGTDRHPTEMAAMQGKRLVYSSETERGRHWAEGKIKDVTGGDKQRARYMRQDEFEFLPRFKLIISGNYEPAIENCDAAMRGRFNVVPFDQTFTGDKADRQLDDKIRAEWPGILQWAIEGCLDWQRNGLVIPEKVRAATDAYFDRQDVFAHWLVQETRRAEHFEETSERIFRSWSAFAKSSGEAPGSQKGLAEKLKRAGFKGPHITTRDSKSVRMWTGLKVMSQ